MKKLFIIAAFPLLTIGAVNAHTTVTSEEVVANAENKNKEKEISFEELPEPVKASISRDHAGAEFKKATKSVDAQGNVTGYTVTVSHGGNDVELKFDGQGNPQR